MSKRKLSVVLVYETSTKYKDTKAIVVSYMSKEFKSIKHAVKFRERMEEKWIMSEKEEREGHDDKVESFNAEYHNAYIEMTLSSKDMDTLGFEIQGSLEPQMEIVIMNDSSGE